MVAIAVRHSSFVRCVFGFRRDHSYAFRAYAVSSGAIVRLVDGRLEGFYADAIHPQRFHTYFMIALEGYALARRSPDSVVPFFLD